VPPSRKLCSDYPLFFRSCSCLRQCRSAQVHRPLMRNRIASSGARSKAPGLVLSLHWRGENPALSPKHGLSCKFASPDARSISLNTERKQRSLPCTSTQKQYIWTTLFALEFYLENHHANVELPALDCNAESCFDKRNGTYGSSDLGFMVPKLRSIVAQLIAEFMNSVKIHVLVKVVAITVLRHDKGGKTMSRSRGHLRFEPLFTTEELGLPEHANIAHVMKVFLAIGDGVAARWIEMPKCVLLLQSVAGIPESGAIYLYDRERHQFYLAVFEHGRDDTLTTIEFEQLMAEYDLLGYIETRSNLIAVSAAGNA
jgi:hypothetical protein